MPRLFGINLIGVLVAAIAFYILGAVWYGGIFSQAWQQEVGMTAEMAENMEGAGLWMGLGFVLTLMQAIGIAFIMKWRAPANIVEAGLTGAIIAVFLALSCAGYAYVYQPAHSLALLGIDGGYMVLGWILCAKVLYFFK